MRIALLAAALAACVGAFAADKPCGKNDAAAAEKAADRVMNWSQLHKAWSDWHQCDTGAVNEVFTDALLRLMVEWKNVDALGTAMKEPGFHDFVLAHLKSDAAKGDRPSVYSRAKGSCPPSQEAMCAELATATQAE